MTEKNIKREIKKIQKEIARLKELIKRVELKPCHSDSDIEQKEKYIEGIKLDIYALEIESDRIYIALLKDKSRRVSETMTQTAGQLRYTV